MNKEKLLLHICCAGCGAYVSQVLKDEGFEVILYYYNPNIFPESEYNIRKKEVEKIARKFDLKFFVEGYNHDNWLEEVKSLEKEPEKGERCLLCYENRLKNTAQKAVELDYDCFASTLSVSPHKLANEINKSGEELSQEYGIKFLVRDFKKKDGFKKASALSKELELYRQDYCGCEFSRKNVII